MTKLLRLLAALPLCALAAAQSTTGGAVAGEVADAQGRRIAGAHVEILEPATGASQVLASGDTGEYRFPGLTPGTYSVVIQAPGFAAWQAPTVTVEIGRLTVLNAALAVGSTQQTVEVHTEAPALDTTTAAVTNNIDQAQIEGLPSNGRRWSNFALLAPGVTPDQDGFGLLSFRGISVLLNNSTVDGADNNQAFFSEERGRTRIGYSTSQAAVREFQVNTSNYSAEYGRAAGGVVNTVTRSGTNRLRGQLFFYDRDNASGSQNRFTTLTTLNPNGQYVTNLYKPKDWRKQWGANAGGPIRHDRIFWFFAYDQYRRNFPGVARAGAPSKLFQAPSAQSLTVLAARIGVSVPQARANYNNVLAGLASLLGNVPRTAEQYIVFPKFDWQFTERDHLTLQYNRMRWTSLNGVLTQASDTYGTHSFGNDYVKGDWGVARWQHFVTSNILNEARYQYGRDTESAFSAQPAPFEQTFSGNVFGRPPQVSLAGGSFGFRFGKPALLDRIAYPDERVQQFVDTATWVRGNHTFKAGYDLNYINEYTNSIYDSNGTYNYSNTLDFVSDYYSPNRCTGSSLGVGNLPCYSYFQQGIGPAAFEFQTADHAAFLTDEWKLRHGLTFSYGIRYEYEQLPNTNPRVANPDLPATSRTPHDTNNFGPRLGLAWDVFGTGHTVLRAGAGIYYGRIINSTVFSALTATGIPNSQRNYFFRPTDAGAPPFPFVFYSTPALSAKPNAVYFDTHFQNPQIYQTEISLEHELRSGTVLSLTYMGSFGRELPNFIDTNINLGTGQTITYQVDDATRKGPLKGTYTSPFYTQRLNPKYQQITAISSASNSVYHAGVLKLSHRLTGSIHLQGAYTFAHAIDYNQNATTFYNGNDVLDPADFHLEYGNSDYDVRHRIAGSIIARAPWRAHGPLGYLVNGYAIAPVIELRTGLPFSMRTSGAVPFTEYVDSLNRTEKVIGIGPGINGSGGDNRIAAVGRNTFRYPRIYNVDARISKTTRIGENRRLEVLGEVFNALNHQNVTDINTTGYVLYGAASPGSLPVLRYESGANGTAQFYTIRNANSNTLYGVRQIQLGIKLFY